MPMANVKLVRSPAAGDCHGVVGARRTRDHQVAQRPELNWLGFESWTLAIRAWPNSWSVRTTSNRPSQATVGPMMCPGSTAAQDQATKPRTGRESNEPGPEHLAIGPGRSTKSKYPSSLATLSITDIDECPGRGKILSKCHVSTRDPVRPASRKPVA